MVEYKYVCTVCEKEIKVDKKRLSKNIFCSLECYNTFRKNNEKYFVDHYCDYCGNKLIRYKSQISKFYFCNKQCQGKHTHELTHIITNCTQCGKEIDKPLNRYKNANNKAFCDHFCSARYRVKHSKNSVNCVSKPERYIQGKLVELYPNINFHFNEKTAIKSELDIYIPDLKLAFELNGVVHYEPIYGQDTLNYIQNNDNRKFQACLENGIELAIVDISRLRYLKPERIAPYLKIITDIIDIKITQTVTPPTILKEE